VPAVGRDHAPEQRQHPRRERPGQLAEAVPDSSRQRDIQRRQNQQCTKHPPHHRCRRIRQHPLRQHAQRSQQQAQQQVTGNAPEVKAGRQTIASARHLAMQ